MTHRSAAQSYELRETVLPCKVALRMGIACRQVNALAGQFRIMAKRCSARTRATVEGFGREASRIRTQDRRQVFQFHIIP